LHPLHRILDAEEIAAGHPFSAGRHVQCRSWVPTRLEGHRHPQGPVLPHGSHPDIGEGRVEDVRPVARAVHHAAVDRAHSPGGATNVLSQADPSRNPSGERARRGMEEGSFFEHRVGVDARDLGQVTIELDRGQPTPVSSTVHLSSHVALRAAVTPAATGMRGGDGHAENECGENSYRYRPGQCGACVQPPPLSRDRAPGSARGPHPCLASYDGLATQALSLQTSHLAAQTGSKRCILATPCEKLCRLLWFAAESGLSCRGWGWDSMSAGLEEGGGEPRLSRCLGRAFRLGCEGLGRSRRPSCRPSCLFWAREARRSPLARSRSRSPG
jgi:hypothetical protein